MAHLVLASPQPGHPQRVSGIECDRCTEHFGFRFRPTVTIKPHRALRLPSGAIVIDNPVVLCSCCRDRGVETVL